MYQDYKLGERNTVIDNLKNAGDFTSDDIDSVLSKLGISSLSNEMVSNLSGGQKQRVAIARAMLFNPKLLLLDEPTSGLDEETTESLIMYLQDLKRSGVTILIISHDRMIVDHADIVYKIKNKRLILERLSSEVNHGKNAFFDKEMGSRVKSKRLGRYLFNSFKANKLELLLLSVPMIVIFALFILGFSFYYSTVVSSYNRMFSGLSNRIIMLDTQELQQKYMEENLANDIDSSLDGERIYFSQEDYDFVSQLGGVSDVALTLGYQVSLADRDEYEINLDYAVSELPRLLKSDLGFLNTDTKIHFKFSGLQAPKRFMTDYNLQNIELLAGDFPSDGSLEILIPDILAKIYFNSGDYDSFVDQLITLETFRYGEVENTDRTYPISGIYKTNYQTAFRNEYLIFLPWRAESILDEIDDLDQMYESHKQMYIGDSKGNVAYLANIFADVDSYLKALGLGYPTMLVKVDDPHAVKNVSENIQEYFPKYRLTSQLSWKEGEYADVYRYERNKMLTIATVIALMLGIVITFLNKGYFNKRNQELAVMYSLGYSRPQLASLILSENLIVFYSCLGLAYLLDIFIYRQVLRKMEFFNGLDAMFDWKVVSIIVLLTLFITLISVLWNIRGVKINNLKKSLSDT